MYFDLANFGLCLMAAVGMQALWEKAEHGFYRGFTNVIIGLLALAIALGWAFQLHSIPGWNHMLVVVAIFAALVTGALHRRLPPALAQGAVIALVVFELFFYGMNQTFNHALEDPYKIQAHDYVSGRRETLDFLRSDRGEDFRVAGFAEAQWSNGWSVWRIPGIYGWNPIMLRRYQEYIREFTQYSHYAQPHGGPDHRLDSPMLDLLGVKYLVATTPIEKEQGLAQSTKYEKVFSDQDWWTVYRNKDYLSRAWFYPAAYSLPEPSTLLAMLNSRWFDWRKQLLFAKIRFSQLPTAPRLTELHTIGVIPDTVTAPVGEVFIDADCAEPRRRFGYWVGKGNWVRFAFKGPEARGRYLLLVEYTAAFRDPAVAAEVAQGDRRQASGPINLLRTSAFNCRTTRSAELGEFELEPGPGQITLSLAKDLAVDLYSLWLVRLPDPTPRETREFSFQKFEVSANRIVFEANLSKDGYVLLNEIDYPGWQATIDGKPAKILRGDGLFRAVWTSAGVHQIEFHFWPRLLLPGAAISLATLAVVAAAMVVTRSSKQSRQDGVQASNPL